jgi:hypothetical protein
VGDPTINGVGMGGSNISDFIFLLHNWALSVHNEYYYWSNAELTVLTCKVNDIHVNCSMSVSNIGLLDTAFLKMKARSCR